MFKLFFALIALFVLAGFIGRKFFKLMSENDSLREENERFKEIDRSQTVEIQWLNGFLKVAEEDLVKMEKARDELKERLARLKPQPVSTEEHGQRNAPILTVVRNGD